MALTARKAENDRRHHEKLDRLVIQPYKNQGAAIRAAAEASGKSVQKYILDAISVQMEKDGLEYPVPEKSGEEGGQ